MRKKTQVIVEDADIKTIHLNSEIDALLLENSL